MIDALVHMQVDGQWHCDAVKWPFALVPQAGDVIRYDGGAILVERVTWCSPGLVEMDLVELTLH